MKIGKVPENVLKRSVFKQIKSKREEVLVHPGVGEDCAVLGLAPDEVFVLSTDPITGAVSDIGTLAVHVTANDLASAGAEPVGILLTILLPQSAAEADLKFLMKEIESACESLKIEIIGGHTEVTAAVNQAVAEELERMGVTYHQMVRLTRDGTGKVTALQADTVLLNQIKSAVTEQVGERLQDLSSHDLSIPLGSLTGEGGGLDPRLLTLGARIMSEYNSDDGGRTALLQALRPFVKERRYAKLDRAIQIAKLSRLIRVALEVLRGGGQDHV